MKRKKGQALLETALALPVIIMLFCGMMDFGVILHANASLNMVTQEAARLAALGSSDAEVKQFAYDKMTFSDKSIDDIKIDPVESDTVNRKPGNYVTVSIDYGVHYITPLIGMVLPSPFPVHVQSTIRIE